jgi:hypothetical protein
MSEIREMIERLQTMKSKEQVDTTSKRSNELNTIVGFLMIQVPFWIMLDNKVGGTTDISWWIVFSPLIFSAVFFFVSVLIKTLTKH